KTDEDLTIPAFVPKVWRIVCCGFKIAKPVLCSTEDYAEIQGFTRYSTISSCFETISKLLKLKTCHESVGDWRTIQGASCETFSKISVFSLHTYENRIELWKIYVPSHGVLQYERTHRATVPICFEDKRKLLVTGSY
ncbi:57_t:CDS:2, partial [Diversispora eburnea]